jgi:beta-galactosidase
VLDSLRLAEAAPAVADKARRIGSVLLTNLGVMVGGRSAAQAYRWEPLDLRPWLNSSLRDEVEGDGKGGWTDQGANDLRGLPLGRQTFAGVEFDIADGCIALRSASQLAHAPAAVQGITVGARCDALAFLHAAAWASGDGQTVAVWEVRYEDGRTEEIAMADGVAVGEWWRPEDLPMAPVAWRGANPVHEPVGLFRHVWRNPWPTVPIATLSVASANTDAVYLLVAISRGELR